MKKSHSSKQWLRRHVNDPYVQRSKKEGYRSRSAYKLTEIDDRDKLLKPGMLVVDLGAAPGGWAQVAAKRVGAKGEVVAIDLVPMEPISNVTILQADFATLHLQAEGVFMVKVFQGAGYDEYLRSIRKAFGKVVVRKPASSRGESAEQYIVARGPRP